MDVVVRNEDPIICDFEELNKNVDNILASVQGVIYQDDQKQEAKKVRASLNKLAREINDKKKEVKRKYLAPYEKFEEQVKAVISKINDASEFVDKQVKEIECVESKGKLLKIKGIWAKYEEELHIKLDFYKYYDEKWLQTSKRLTKIEKEIGNIFLDAIQGDDSNKKETYVIKVTANKGEMQTVCGLIKQMALEYEVEKELEF